MNIKVGEIEMKINKLKKWTVLIALLLLSSAVFIPVTQATLISKEKTKTIPTKNETVKPAFSVGGRDFSFVLHRIKQEDDIDPGSSADWRIRIYINGERKTYEKNGDDVTVDKTITWENAIPDDMKLVEIRIELQEKDISKHDIADISAHKGGGKDDSTDFDRYRGAVFIHTFNVETNTWVPQDENNDYVRVEDDANVRWYKTSGNFDGSTKTDENDATVWFNVFCENRAPYPPEKPQGPTEGETNHPYVFKTRCQDPDNDRIKFGWDWDGDGQVDEITDYYDTWQTCSITHTWTEAGIYHVRVMAIDTHDMTSELSDPLIVEIAGVDGKSGFKVEKTWYGHLFTIYLNHRETQDLVKTIRQGTNVVGAVAALIIAIAAAAGIPLDPAIATAIATAIIRLGAETIAMMDMHNKGVYIKVYLIEIAGIPLTQFGYIWAQK